MDDLESAMKEESTCRGCGGPKPTGRIVCGDCLKSGNPPLKTFRRLPGETFPNWISRWLTEVRGRPIILTLR